MTTNKPKQRWLQLGLLVLVVGVGLFARIGCSQGGDTGKSPDAARASDDAERKILLALESPISLVYIEASLTDIVDDIKKEKGIDVQISFDALDENDHRGFTCEIKNKPLRDALKSVLAQHKLGFKVIEGILLITNEERQKSKLFYDID